MKSALALVLLVALALLAWQWTRTAAPGESIDELVGQAESFYDANDHDSSAEIYRRAAAVARAEGDLRRATALEAQSGVCLKMAGRTGEAREALLPALEAARGFDDARTEGLALGNLARVEALDGNFELALDYLQQLAALAERIDDPRLEVQTLEQVAMVSLDLGDAEGALATLDRALEANAANVGGEDDRRDALLRQQASVQVQLVDDEGAVASWNAATPAPAAMANQALLLSELELHEAAATLARAAAHQFDEEGPTRRRERDDALLLSISEDLRAGERARCRERLDAVLQSGADARALAPFHVIEGRLALTEGRADEAADVLQAAAQAFDDESRAEPVLWLAAVARGVAGQLDQGRALLDPLPPSLARCVVLGWLHREQPPATGLALDLLPELARAAPGDDRSLTVLERNCPVPLPSLAWLALHHHLADADRLRSSGRGELAEEWLRRGADAALTWQWLEARRRLAGRWPEGGVPAHTAAWITAATQGHLPDDEALIAVLPSSLLSYEILCTSSLGATSFGVPAEAELASLVGGIAAALHAGDRDAVAAPAHKLYEALFGLRARIDLADRSRWTLLLPDVLAAAPPALWVTGDVLPGQPASWLVRERLLRLLPHAPTRAPAAAPLSVGSWLRAGEPSLDPDRSALVVPALRQRYGDSILQPGALRRVPGDGADEGVLTGAALTASGLEVAAAGMSVLELSVPGLGGGRLAGLLLSPDPLARRGDERAGVLPWFRLGELRLPPVVILDRTRFDPTDREHGMASAAAAVLAGSTDWAMLSRWPLPPAARARLLAGFALGLSSGADPATALVLAQRTWLDEATATGRDDLENPRSWAALTVWGGP